MKDLGTTRSPLVAERKERVGTYVSSKSLRYSGAQPLMILKVISRGSQCSFSNDGVIWSRTLHFRNNLAAEFGRRCSLLISLAGSPYNKLLQ